MNKIYKIGILATILLLQVIMVSGVSAQSSGNTGSTGSYSPFKLLNGIISPQGSAWTFRLPYMGGSGTKCVQVDNDGDFSVAADVCGSGGGGTFPFTSVVGYNSTSTVLGLLNGFFSTASSTLSGATYFPALSQGVAYIGSSGRLNVVASSSAGFALDTRNLTVAGTANQITSSAGSQNLTADRTWTLSFPNQVIFPQYASTTLGLSTPYASTTALHIGTGQGFLYAGSGQKVNAVASSSINLSSLNNDLASLSATNASLTFTGSYNGSVARTVGLNLANANTWSALQTFNYSSTTGQATFANASSTQWVGGGLQTCDPTTGKLTWNSGTLQFGCATDQNTGGSGGNATSTTDWIIYKSGNNVLVYDTISRTDVLTTTTFGAACNYVVNAATSTSPARTSVVIRTGKYNAGSDCVISGNSSQYSPQFNFLFNASTTEVYATTGQNVFSFKDQAQVRVTNLTCGLGGSGNCLHASSSAGTVQSSVRESIFENIDAYATSTHTGWVVDFKEDFRNKFTDFDWKFTANGYRSQNNYTNAQFINGDSTFERGFVELCDASVGIGYVFKLDGVRGQVNQNTFSDINGIDCEANGTVSMFYGLNATRNRVENFNVEEVGTTTEIYGSSGSLFAFGNTFSSNKYKTTGNTSGVSFFTNANAFNNQYECWEEEVEGAVVLFRDLNTLDTQAPNAFGNFSGGVCRLNDNGGSVSMSTTTTSVVQSIRDNITGLFSYTNSIKQLDNRLVFNFQNGVSTFWRYSNSAMRLNVDGTERLTVSGSGFGTTTVTGLTVNGSATSTSNVGFNLSGGCFAINNVCVGGSGGDGTVTSVVAGVGFQNRGLNITGSGTLNVGIATSSNPTVGHATYWSATGDASNPATLTSVATSTPTIGGSLSYSGTMGNVFGGSSGTLSLNMANANTWTALQSFQYSSSTNYSSFVTSSTTDAYFGTGQGIAYIGSGGRLRTVATSTFALSQFTNDLASLSATNASLTFTGSYNGSAARTVGLNLANANTWTVNQTFNYSSSTVYSSFVTASTTNLFAGFITLSTTTAGTLKVSSNGVVWSDTSGGGGGYATIQDEGSGLTVRTILNFTGSGVACADDTTRTTCTINAGAASAGGSDTQVQFNDGSSLGGAVAFVWDKNKQILGIGTTTPWTNHKTSIATSTGQNLVLLTGGNDAGISFRNIGGSLYLGTTTPTTGATSTSPAAFVVDYSSGLGKVGIGTTTPWGLLSVMPSTYDYSYPLFQVATSTGNFGSLMTVTATSSNLVSNTVNGKVLEVGVRVGIGLWNYEGYGGLLDQLVVNGRFNTNGMLYNWCDAPQQVALSADGVTTGCGGWYFAEDGTGTTAIGAVTGGGASYTRVAAAVNNDGAGVFAVGSTGTGWFTLASSTPVMETNYRIRNTNSTTTQYYIGFSNLNIAGTTYETEPTIGCYFTASSTTANWRAICRTAAGGGNMTMVDTGIASTSSNAANGTGYQFRKFRIQADSTKAEFFIKASGSSDLVKVAQISTTYPANTLLNAGMHYGIVSINTSSGFDYFRNRFWWRDVLPSL